MRRSVSQWSRGGLGRTRRGRSAGPEPGGGRLLLAPSPLPSLPPPRLLRNGAGRPPRRSPGPASPRARPQAREERERGRGRQGAEEAGGLREITAATPRSGRRKFLSSYFLFKSRSALSSSPAPRVGLFVLFCFFRERRGSAGKGAKKIKKDFRPEESGSCESFSSSRQQRRSRPPRSPGPAGPAGPAMSEPASGC